MESFKIEDLIINITSIQDKKEKGENSKILNLKSDKNIEFQVEFYVFENNLIFEAKSKNIFPQKDYKKIYTFNAILTNKFFSICDNMEEVYKEIDNQINNNEDQIKIIEKSNLLNLIIPVNTKKISEFNFEIDEISKNMDNKINDLYSIINQLSNEIKDLKEKNKILEEKNKKLEEKVEEIDNLLLSPLKEKLKKEEKEKDLNKLKEWISLGENVEFNLIFRKSEDGDTTEDFHRLCDNKGKTLIMIETIEGRKFGGFTNDSWNTSNNWRSNPNDFVFSLDLNKKYSNNNNSLSTVSDSSQGPVFGYSRPGSVDIFFRDNTLNTGISNSSSSFKTNGELNNKQNNFKTKELEVYQVIIN